MADEYEDTVAKPRSQKSTAIDLATVSINTTEQTFKESAMHPDSMDNPYNPDFIVKKDYTYAVYEEMLEDDQVTAALNLKKDLVVGSGWFIQSEDEEKKKNLEEVLTHETDRPLSEILYDMLQAFEFGFSVSEKLFKNLDDGTLALKNIKPRHPSTWLLWTDPHGNVIKYIQRGRTNELEVDPDNLIHYINNERHQNPYGMSDLYAAFQAWTSKKHISRYYGIFLENIAGPKPVAKYDRNAPQAAVDAIFNAIKSFQTKTAMTIPKEFEVEFLEAKSTGDAYIKGLNLFNMFIGRAMFIPDLMGFSGSETSGGSFSLGQEQIGLFYKHINRRRQIIENLMDKHIIRPMCMYNYGIEDEYPSFKFNPLSKDDAIKDSELWIKGVQGAKWQPTPEEINHFRKLVDFPQSDDIVMGSDIMMEQLKAKTGVESDKPEDGGKTAEKPLPEDLKKKELALALSTLPGNYKKKVDFKMADRLLKTAVDKIQTELAPVVDETFENLYKQLYDKKIIEKKDIERAESLKLINLSKMQAIFKKHFRGLYNDGEMMAKHEIQKSQSYAEQNIPNDEFLKFLENETFKYVGDWSYGIISKSKDKLIQAIKDGLPLSEVLKQIEQIRDSYSDVSIERYSRTKTTEVFNKGRKDYFDSTGVVEAYQYSAIIDDVTSEICGQLNGLTFPKDEAPIPPLHFNCRSLLIPITKYEDWSADGVTNDGSNVDKFLEDNVTDKGFAVYEKKQLTPEDLKKYTRPEITDKDVAIRVDVVGDVQTTTYSFNGKEFQKSIATYKDGDLVSLKHERLDEETKV